MAEGTLTTAVDGVFSILTSVVTFITGNPIAMIFLAASLVALGIGLFYKLKH